MITYGRQDIRQEDIDAVIAVLKSDFLTQGPAVPAFERAVAEKVGAAYGVAVNSATSALHIACAALDLGPGDLMWTSPITFVASANCGVYCGADVDFVDIDPDTFNMSPVAIAEKLEAAERLGRLPKVLVPVHMCGRSADMEEIGTLARRYGVRVIEDASHAIGGKYQGDYIGACPYSDITVFSFHPVKIVTTAEGGMAVTNDAGLAQQMSVLRSHGVTKDANLMTHAPDGPWYYQQIDLGYNYRMTEIQAALGMSQMNRLDEYITRRHELAHRYDKLLSGLPLTLSWQHPDGYSGLHLYVIRLQLDQIAKTHLEVFEALREHEIGVNLHYIPVYRQPFYSRFGFSAADFPEAEIYYREAISIPMYSRLDEVQQDYIVAALQRTLS